MDANLVFQFEPNDAAYLAWLQAHSGGFVLTSSHSLYAAHTVIHRATCPLIRSLTGNAQPGGFTERGYLKVFGDDVPSLEAWVRRQKPDGISRLCSRCRPGEPVTEPQRVEDIFRVGHRYAKNDIYQLCDVPEQQQRGAWDTGYTKYQDAWFIFCNVGIPGRTGHDYDNHFVGDDLVWYGKTGAHPGQPSIQSMLDPSSTILVFYREDDRAPFTFAGKATAVQHTAETPIQILWSFQASIDQRMEVLPQEVSDPPDTYVEGAVKRVLVNAYERNPQARDACLRAHGCSCVACGFNFAATYGEIGQDFIHVHHLKPVALAGSEYTLDPVEDLRPVCPNCHAMLHRRPGGAPYSIEELIEILASARQDS